MSDMEKKVQEISKGRKHRKDRPPPKETRYTKGLQDSPVLKCPHIHTSGNKRTTRKDCQASKLTLDDIEGISSNRLALLARYFQHSGQHPIERRGGDRSTEKDAEITQGIKNHIKSYPCRESHYCRKKTTRFYLAPELNITRMWQQFKSKRNAEGKPTCSLSKYKRIFYTCFNIGFGNPHTDTCSECKRFELLIKQCEDTDKKYDLRTKHKLHKMRAKKFYSLLKTEIPGSINIVFDMQQNQPLPKLSVGEIFYSRQVWFYNLLIMEHNKKQEHNNIYNYTWLETESTRGANQVASCVADFLEKVENKLSNDPDINNGSVKCIRLFSDSCSSQNKNTILMVRLMEFLKNSAVFDKITHYFPIRGHSFLPADRVFGRIEKDYRKHEEIISPEEYRNIIGKHGTSLCYGKDFNFYDLKKRSQNILKSKMPFKISEARIIQYEKTTEGVEVSVSNTYSGSMVTVEVLKKKKSLNHLSQAGVLRTFNAVSKKKSDDIKKLLPYFTIPECATKFYTDVLNAEIEEDNEDMDESTSKFYDDADVY